MSDMKVPSIRILVVISTPKLIDTAIYLFQEGSIPIQYQTNAIGTASNEIMDALGLGSTEKSVLISLMPKAFADQMLLMLKKEMQLHTPNSGVAFTLAMTGSNNHMLRMPSTLNEYETNLPIRSETMNKNDIKYTLIAAVVNQGYSEEVMQAAGSAGADGGTVLHSRQTYTKSMLRKAIDRIKRILEIDDLHPHMFCYSHATVLHELGVDDKTIQHWEGHANQATTANIYIKNTQTMTDRAEAILSDFASANA